MLKSERDKTGSGFGRVSDILDTRQNVTPDLQVFPDCHGSNCEACIGVGSSTHLARVPGGSQRWHGMASSGGAARSDSLIEEIKGLKGRDSGVPKMLSRQLATERFTEPREAIVPRFLKRTPTQGGRVALGSVFARQRGPLKSRRDQP